MSRSQHRPEPAPQFSDEQIVNWLIDECRDAGTRISTLTTSGDRIMAAGSTVIALVATIAVGGSKRYLLMWLPLGIAVVIVYGLYLNNMTRTLIGYKIGLEKEIERRVGLPLIAWQSRINVRAGSSHHVKSVFAMCGAVFVSSAGLALNQAIDTLSPGAWGHERAGLYVALTSASIVISTAVIGYCLWIQEGTREAATQRVTDMFGSDGRPSGS